MLASTAIAEAAGCCCSQRAQNQPQGWSGARIASAPHVEERGQSESNRNAVCRCWIT